jgi:serine/threonine protein kinase
MGTMADLPATIGPYRVVRQLGEGGMGTVYEAKHEAIGRRVAIKVLHARHARDAEFTSRFFNEARAVNMVDHPGLVQISDYGQLPEGTAYIVMEYLKGESLDHRLNRTERRLPAGEVLQIAWQLADSLASAHTKGIVHRDLKPENVMMVPDPHMLIGERAKLLDFGIAKVTEEPGKQSVKTQQHAVMGTPYYMSPEQCEASGAVDPKSDVYSLGCMIYEMFTGRPPFTAPSPARVFSMHITQEPEPLRKLVPTMPGAIADLVHRMLRKERTERPSMRQLSAELESMFKLVPAPLKKHFDGDSDEPSSISEAVQINSTLGRAAVQLSGPQKRKIGLILGGGMTLFVALFAAAWTLRPRPQPGVSPPIVITKTVTPPVAPRTVTLRLESDPPGAEVVCIASGEVLGATPWRLTQEAMPGERKLRLRLDGYAEQEVTLRTDDNDGLKVSLSALPGRGKKPIGAGKRHDLNTPGPDSKDPADAGNRGKRPPKGKKLPTYVKPPLED